MNFISINKYQGRIESEYGEELAIITPMRAKGQTFFHLQEALEQPIKIFSSGVETHWEYREIIEYEGKLIIIGPWIEGDFLSSVIRLPRDSARSQFTILQNHIYESQSRFNETSWFWEECFLNSIFFNHEILMVMPKSYSKMSMYYMNFEQRLENHTNCNNPILSSYEAHLFAQASILFRILSHHWPFEAQTEEEINENMKYADIDISSLVDFQDERGHLNINLVLTLHSLLLLGQRIHPKRFMHNHPWYFSKMEDETNKKERIKFLLNLQENFNLLFLKENENALDPLSFKKESTLKDTSKLWTLLSLSPVGEFHDNAKTSGEKRKKQEKRGEFIRKNSNLVFFIATFAILVGAGIVSLIYSYLEPSPLEGLNAEAVLSVFYHSINDLDYEMMKEASSSPEAQIKINFVTELSAIINVRKVYTRSLNFFSGEDWITLGKPTLPNGSEVFGLSDLKISLVDTLQEGNRLRKIYEVEYIRYETEKPNETASTANINQFLEKEVVILEKTEQLWQIISIKEL